jgi:hypothetical protein
LKNTGYVSGIYYEYSKWPTRLSGISIVGDSSDVTVLPQAPQYYVSPDYPPIAKPGYLFLSVADFSGLKRVDLCHIGGHCTGMLLHYMKGPNVVLGQWHSALTSQHSCILDGNEPNPTRVHFRIARFWQITVVADIRFSNDNGESAPSSDFQIFNIPSVSFRCLDVCLLLTRNSTLHGGLLSILT